MFKPLVVIALFALTGCVAKYTQQVRFTVVSEVDGAPVSGALVRAGEPWLFGRGVQGETDDLGRLTLDVSSDGEVLLQAFSLSYYEFAGRTTLPIDERSLEPPACGRAWIGAAFPQSSDANPYPATEVTIRLRPTENDVYVVDVPQSFCGWLAVQIDPNRPASVEFPTRLISSRPDERGWVSFPAVDSPFCLVLKRERESIGEAGHRLRGRRESDCVWKDSGKYLFSVHEGPIAPPEEKLTAAQGERVFAAICESEKGVSHWKAEQILREQDRTE